MIDATLLTNVILATVAAGTPLALAALGELTAERAGVLNLGVEGMMLMGAISGFMTTVATGMPVLGFLAAIVTGALMAYIFAFITQHLLANQVATGLALTIFGTGLSAFMGEAYTGISLSGIAVLHIPGLSDIPVLGTILLSFDPLVYLSWLLAFALYWFLYHSKPGLTLRAVGESPEVAHALGYRVVRIRYLAVLFGGAM